MSEPMVELMDDLEESLGESRLKRKGNPKALTHACLLSALDDVIVKMI